MDLAQTYDPELVAALQALPVDRMINWNDLPATREFLKQMLAMAGASIPDSPHVTKKDLTVRGPKGAPDVAVRVYRPTASSGTLPGLLWIHGGGYVLGNIQQDDHLVQQIVEEVGCVVVGSHEVFLDEDVEYALRLARAGIPVELHVYPRAFHGWDALMPTGVISQRAAAERNQALKHALYPESTLVPV